MTFEAPRINSDESWADWARRAEKALPTLSNWNRPLPQKLASTIDHTLLKPEATFNDLQKLCAEARANGFFSVCVNPAFVGRASKELSGSSVKTITVVGFPLGATFSKIKADEARAAIDEGAAEIDMVLWVGALRSGDGDAVYEDICKVREACGSTPLKVILETTLLNTQQKILACGAARQAGAAYVKTSTGFAGGGATVEDIQLMRWVVGPDLGVKASGGVRTRDDALAMLRAGATRIGTSGGVAICKGDVSESSY